MPIILKLFVKQLVCFISLTSYMEWWTFTIWQQNVPTLKTIYGDNTVHGLLVIVTLSNGLPSLKTFIFSASYLQNLIACSRPLLNLCLKEIWTLPATYIQYRMVFIRIALHWLNIKLPRFNDSISVGRLLSTKGVGWGDVWPTAQSRI